MDVAVEEMGEAWPARAKVRIQWAADEEAEADGEKQKGRPPPQPPPQP
jgi:hypothetical protein